MDVEKTLNCCGFSSVNLNQTCPAVSGCSPSAAVLLGPSLSKARLLRCSVASPIPPAPPAPASCRRTPGTCSTSLAASACSSASRRSVGRRVNVCARFLQLSELLLVSFRSSESGSLTDTGTWRIRGPTRERSCNRDDPPDLHFLYLTTTLRMLSTYKLIKLVSKHQDSADSLSF